MLRSNRSPKAVRKVALIGIDWELCFSRPAGSIPGEGVGSLYVKDAEQALAAFNELRASTTWDFVGFCRDLHPKGHISFVTSHEGAVLFSTIETKRGPQVMWPEHGVKGTKGSEYDPDLVRNETDYFFNKGTDIDTESYSIVGDATADKRYERTKIIQALNDHGITEVHIGGLAKNYCVAFSAIDLARANFTVFVHEAATKPVLDGTEEAQMAAMTAAGVTFI